jgi:hypothetical protein
MSDKTQQTGQVQAEAGQAEAGQGVAGPVLEGVVVGHATCERDGCTAPTERVTDPFALEVYGDRVEIDICEEHLADLCDDI